MTGGMLSCHNQHDRDAELVQHKRDRTGVLYCPPAVATHAAPVQAYAAGGAAHFLSQSTVTYVPVAFSTHLVPSHSYLNAGAAQSPSQPSVGYFVPAPVALSTHLG